MKASVAQRRSSWLMIKAEPHSLWLCDLWPRQGQHCQVNSPGAARAQWRVKSIRADWSVVYMKFILKLATGNRLLWTNHSRRWEENGAVSLGSGLKSRVRPPHLLLLSLQLLHPDLSSLRPRRSLRRQPRLRLSHRSILNNQSPKKTFNVVTFSFHQFSNYWLLIFIQRYKLTLWTFLSINENIDSRQRDKSINTDVWNKKDEKYKIKNMFYNIWNT